MSKLASTVDDGGDGPAPDDRKPMFVRLSPSQKRALKILGANLDIKAQDCGVFALKILFEVTGYGGEFELTEKQTEQFKKSIAPRLFRAG